MMDETRSKYCVIGAGASGLTVCKNLLQESVSFDCFERQDTLGGNWNLGMPNSSIYDSTHLISSKTLTEYTDYPMPEEFPHYPHHTQVLSYLHNYAAEFNLSQHIQFNTAVDKITPGADGHWKVKLKNEQQTRTYQGVIIANGHHWDPKWPEFCSTFAGEMIHSGDYKSPEQLVGKRVLVIGGGNSGCDIAVEAAIHAKAAYHSLRRGYHYFPKFLMGKPSDICGERLLKFGLPLWLRRRIIKILVKIVMGNPNRFGLDQPDHQLFETHPIINSQLFYHLGHGKIVPKKDIERFDGNEVFFVDGSSETIDLIVCATGFNLTIPFIDNEHLNWKDGWPHLYLNCFHPENDNLFVAGMIQPDSGLWGIVDCQAQLIARFINANQRNSPQAERFRQKKLTVNTDLSQGIKYVKTQRHRLEVEHYSYRKRLQKLISQFS